MGRADFLAALELAAEQQLSKLPTVIWGMQNSWISCPTSELLARQENVLRRKMKAVGFPYPATIEQFDFSLRPELKRPVILRYFDSSFITNSGSLIPIGPSGLGKTHLSISLGTKMVQLGYSVRFIVAQQLANAMLQASSRAEIAKIIEPLIKCDLLILDEFGYLALDPQVGPVLYEIIAGRYRNGATIITSNKSLANWGEFVRCSVTKVYPQSRELGMHKITYLLERSDRLPGPPQDQHTSFSLCLP